MKRKPKADCVADTRGGRWAGIPVCVIKSAAYQHLSLWARAILVELCATLNGWNNGKIALSQRQIAAALNTTNFRAIGKAIAQLMRHGLVDVSAEGKWKERRAREYRLTFVSTKGARATNDYLAWKPEVNSGADGVSAAKAPSADDASATPQKSTDNVSARIAEGRRKTADRENRTADDASSLINKPYPQGEAKREQTALSTKQTSLRMGGCSTGGEHAATG